VPRCSTLICTQRTFLNVYDPDILKCSGQPETATAGRPSEEVAEGVSVRTTKPRHQSRVKRFGSREIVYRQDHVVSG
jgi:hypothetical protein